MTSKDKKHAARQKQWESENRTVMGFRKEAPRLKALARARGYGLRYFDFLDSNEAVFQEIVTESYATYPSLARVAEVPWAEFHRVDERTHGVGPDWQHVIFTDGSDAAATYNDPDPAANVNGFTQGYLQPDGRPRTLVLIPEAVRCRFQHRDFKYHFKLIALLHELGHVQDMERQTNFDFAARTADIIAAEVYAHRFALAEANRLGLFAVAVTLADSLAAYVGGSDYRAAVAGQVLEGYQPPPGPSWGDLTAGELSPDEVAMLKNMAR